MDRHSEVQQLKGVGPEAEKDLERLGISTIEDLWFHIPFRYENIEIRPIEDIEHNEQATISGEMIGEARVRRYSKAKNILTFRLDSGGHAIEVTAFNRAFLKGKLSPGMTITVTGKWNRSRAQVTAKHIEIGERQERTPYDPIYQLTGKLTNRQLKTWIADLSRNREVFPLEMLPFSIREKYKLPSIEETLRQLHQPQDAEQLKHARRRFIYEEFLTFQLRMHAYKHALRKSEYLEGLQDDQERVSTFIQGLPFTLTGAQERSLQEILFDMRSGHRMNRLLQGDVGSGKTAVAAIAMYAAVTAGKQAALMVPTEILAGQHYEAFKEMFADDPVNVSVLTGSTKAAERRDIIEQLENKEVDLIIGTHALIQPDVPIPKLGLVVTDEQHRFGVKQRRALKEKGDPDVLFMTATPIPRTLAITAYGDMDVSRIDELPTGRKAVETYWVNMSLFERVVNFIKREIQNKRQVYFVCPLIEESEQLDVQNAIDLHAQLQAILSGDRVGLLHGRLHNDEKREVMEQFTSQNLDVLVATTVIEVGVNVPNATCMVIYDADRFGLAQLHQLRGRVGRGHNQSYCILLANPSSETGKERMRIMTETTDGFVLAEEDLKLRGPGELLGKKQSGMPKFRLADPVHDYRALETARQDAKSLFESSSFWEDPEYEALRTDLVTSGALSEDKLD
ncbi:ATP-dependent DNA helicase RecG [Geomicrobium sp. JSM 1781026]|uniref:ATP-dependent DNA helicase RecG n=1 Tax=Geomicrobium sp. JSM 1781026 TaxID=3344580 RepID=UPI0035C11F42